MNLYRGRSRQNTHNRNAGTLHHKKYAPKSPHFVINNEKKIKGSIRLHSMDWIMPRECYESTNATTILGALQSFHMCLSELREESTQVDDDILLPENKTIKN